MGISVKQADIRFGIAAWHWGNYFADKSVGIELTDSPWRRPPANCAPVDAKAAGLYMICTLAKKRAEERGFADALMLDHEGNVAEATGANIFFFQDGVWHTPKPICFLNGITRQTVMQLAREQKVIVVERTIKPSELKDFSQCFITGSAAEVTPVSRIMDAQYEVGEETTRFANLYDQVVLDNERSFDPAVLKLG